MPSRFVVRKFSIDKAYHVFNRGVEKRKIFLDDQDHRMFVYYLRIYLSDPRWIKKQREIPPRLLKKNLFGELELYTLALMPNHFHLHVRPKNTDVIPRLMKQLSNAYTKYFNTRYERVGGLFQGRYKTGEIENDEQNIHLHRYILINPLVSCLAESLEEYPWTSFYRKNVSRLNELCNDEEFRSRFSSLEDYKKFIYDQVDYSKSLHELKNLVVED